MSATGSEPKRRTPARAGRRAGGAGTRRPTRSEIRAAAARTAQSASGLAVEPTGAVVSPGSARSRGERSGGRVAARPAALSRDEEYRFIQADLRRMLVTAGSLLAVMLVLLVLIDL